MVRIFKSLILLCILLCILLTIATSELGYVVLVDKIDAQIKDPEVVELFDVSLWQEYNRSYFNVDVRLRESISALNLKILVDMQVPGKARKRLLNTQIDLCATIVNAKNNKAVQLFIDIVNSHANEKVKCPLKSNFTYKVTRAYLHENDLLPYWPECKFNVVFDYQFRGKPIVLVHSNGSIRTVVNFLKSIKSQKQ